MLPPSSQQNSKRRHIDARIVVASTFRKVGLVRRRQRGHSLAVAAGLEPGALFGTHHAGTNRVGDDQRQVHFTEVVPHFDPRAITQAARVGIQRVHLQHRGRVVRREPAESRSRAPVR